jgi:hypothetical protein
LFDPGVPRGAVLLTGLHRGGTAESFDDRGTERSSSPSIIGRLRQRRVFDPPENCQRRVK